MAKQRSVAMSSRRSEIVEAAAELFAEKGFAGTTVRDIADAVGILSGSLYHHFNAKEEIVNEIFSAYFDELQGRWDEIIARQLPVEETFEAMLRAAFTNVDSHTAAARLFTNEWLQLRHLGDFEVRWNRIENLWLQVIRQGVDEGKFRSDIDAVLLFSVAMDVIRGLSGWYRHGGRYSIEKVCEAYVGVLMTGVMNGNILPYKDEPKDEPQSVS